MRTQRIVMSVIAGILVVGMGLPVVASGFIGDRIGPLLADEFGVSQDEVTLDVRLKPIWDILGGHVGDIGILVEGWEFEVTDGTVVLDPLAVQLYDVDVSLGDAVGGTLEEVAVGEGIVAATATFESLTPIVRARVARQGLQLESLARAGEDVALTMSLDGAAETTFTVEAQLVVEDDVIALVEATVVDGPSQAQALVDRADLTVALPELPAGIVIETAVVLDEGIRLEGRVEQTLNVLAALR